MSFPHFHHTTIGKKNTGNVSSWKMKMRRKRKAKKATREIDQLKDGVKDLESEIRECAGSMLLFLLL